MTPVARLADVPLQVLLGSPVIADWNGLQLQERAQQITRRNRHGLRGQRRLRVGHGRMRKIEEAPKHRTCNGHCATADSVLCNHRKKRSVYASIPCKRLQELR